MNNLRLGGNRPWHIEIYGIDTLPESERTGRLRDIVWIWFAANIGILAMIYGALLDAFGLNLWQSILVMGFGLSSFFVVGLLAVSGRDGGAPMMTLSRVVFGVYGNILPTLISWLSLVGWETITVIMGTLTLSSLFQPLIPQPLLRDALALGVMIGATVASGILGQATLVVVQKWASYLFGLSSIIVLIFMIPGVHWHALLTRPPASWTSRAFPAWAIIFSGTGLSWANASADYSRYLPHSAKTCPIIVSTVLSATIPLFVLMGAGLLVATRDPSLATSANPIASLGHLLPAWMSGIYLITAAGGLIVEANLSLYSSGLNLQTLFVPYARYKTVLIDVILMMSGTVYVLFFARNLLGPFESFVILLGIGIAAWSGVFLAHRGVSSSIRLRGSFVSGRRHLAGWRSEAVLAWIAGTVFGLLFAATPWFHGPWSSTALGSGYGLIGSLVVAGLVESIGLLLLSGDSNSKKKKE